MHRFRFLPAALLALAAGARANDVSVIAVANLQGNAFFRSDARVFNRSYSDTITVTANYFCSGSCGSTPQTFQLPPRASQAFDDVAVSLFSAPNSQGTVVFSTANDDLVVTSRLYSVKNGGSFGQFVPGLEDEDAYRTQVLTSLQNSPDLSRGFRANAVAFNPSSTATVTLVFHLFNGDGTFLGSSAPAPLAPRQFLPAFSIFGAAGASSVATTNAYCVVTSDPPSPFFVGAAVLDNTSQDTIFVKGEEDDDFQPPVGSAPTASFVVSGDAIAGAPVSFQDTSTGRPAAWSWSFGDPASGSANTSGAQNPTHTYAAAGTYAVTLTATNGFGASAPASNPVTVTAVVPPTETVRVTMQQFTFNDGEPIVLHVGTTYQLVFHALDDGVGQGHGFPGISQLGLPELDIIRPGHDFSPPPITPNAGEVGVYTFFCSSADCGSGHSNMSGTIQVVP